MGRKFFLFILLAPSFSSAGENSTYSFSWLDQDKEVHVLQNRRYRKKGHLLAHGGVGYTMSGAFTSGLAFQVKADYFFHEEFGLEFSYTKNSTEENSTAELLRSSNKRGIVPWRRMTQDYMGGLVVWSPFYSKINAFNGIFYVDWVFGLGYGKLNEKNNQRAFKKSLESGNSTQEGAALSEENLESHSGIMWSVGNFLYLSKVFSLRLDVNGFHYQTDPITGEQGGSVWNEHIDLVAMIGIKL